jgi:Ni,Fe-hydrogenase I cytochrome b subunit
MYTRKPDRSFSRGMCLYVAVLFRNYFQECSNSNAGRAIAQAVSRRLPTAAARVQARVRSYAICGEESGTGAGFLQVLRFPLPIRIPQIAPQS